MGGRPRLQNLCLSDPERAPYAIFSQSSMADACILSHMQPSQHHRSEVYFHVGGAFPRRHWCPLKGILQHRTLDFGFPYDQFDSNLPVWPQIEAFAREQSCPLLPTFSITCINKIETLTLHNKWGPHHASALERGVFFGDVDAG